MPRSLTPSCLFAPQDESLVESDEDDDDSDAGLGSDEEEGLDWDELEEQAAK